LVWHAPHSSFVTDTIIKKRAATPKADQWAERIAAQQVSGIPVK
jgi:hypothetical protein